MGRTSSRIYVPPPGSWATGIRRIRALIRLVWGTKPRKRWRRVRRKIRRWRICGGSIEWGIKKCALVLSLRKYLICPISEMIFISTLWTGAHWVPSLSALTARSICTLPRILLSCAEISMEIMLVVSNSMITHSLLVFPMARLGCMICRQTAR